MNNPPFTLETARKALTQLGFYGLALDVETYLQAPWLAQLIAIEQTERQRRSLKRRLDDAKLGRFKPLADFEWDWPESCDRSRIEETFNLKFINEGDNIIFVRGNELMT